MTTIALQAGHQHIGSNCSPDMRSGTGAPGEATWTPTIRAAVAKILRAHKFTVVEADANLNCAATHPHYDLTLAIHYQSDNPKHTSSGFGVYVPDASVDRDNPTSIKRARAIAAVYAARTKLANYSSPRLGLNKATWENPNTLFYYLWNSENGPLALIECGVGAVGARDHTLLYSHAALIAAAIAEGICTAFGVNFVAAPAPVIAAIPPHPPAAPVALPESPPVVPPGVLVPPASHPDVPPVATPVIKPVPHLDPWQAFIAMLRRLFRLA